MKTTLTTFVSVAITNDVAHLTWMVKDMATQNDQQEALTAERI